MREGETQHRPLEKARNILKENECAFFPLESLQLYTINFKRPNAELNI